MKSIEFNGHIFTYRIDKAEDADLHAIHVIGGPYKARAYSSCGKTEVKKHLMTLIKAMRKR